MANKIQGSRFFVSHILIVLFFCCFDSHAMETFEGLSFINIGVVQDPKSRFSNMINLCIKMAISDFYLAHPNYTTRLQLHTKDAESVLDVDLAGNMVTNHWSFFVLVCWLFMAYILMQSFTANLSAILTVDQLKFAFSEDYYLGYQGGSFMKEFLIVLELLEHEHVHGVLGAQGSIEEIFVAEIGKKAHVPIISVNPWSSTLSHSENHYFIRSKVDDSVQARSLAAICQGFGWSEVVILYEDTEYGHQFLSHLNKAFQDVEIGIAHLTAIPPLAENSYLFKELSTLKKKQTRVFLVHMNASLGFRLFTLAHNLGMMSEGYAWIITDSVSNFLNSVDFATRDSMDGVVGIRPYVSFSEGLQDFQERWGKNSMILKKNNTGPIMDLNVYGLWAYDAITALAIAVEKIGPLNSSSLYVKTVKRTKNTNVRISAFGPGLLRELSSTKFSGLSGDFQLVDGNLKPSAFEIFNIIGTGERRVGFWTLDRGIIRELSSSGEATQIPFNKLKELKNVVWPGDSVTRPKGWAIPPTGSLRVGVPWISGYTEFVNAAIDPETNNINATGFAIDIFLAALKVLPFPINYEFHCYNESKSSDWSYDNMLRGIPQKKYDMVVADTTIWAPRASYVDFSLPYTESGVVLVVKNKKPLDMWIFTKPLRWDLWLAIAVACIFMGIVIWILERRVTHPPPGNEPVTTHNERHGVVYLAPIAVLAFQERNMVTNHWSFFVLVCWLFMAYILMQSFTANLSAILTVDQLKFAFSEDYYLGYQGGSFMKEFLIGKLHINESRLRGYSSMEQFHDAMSRGSKNGGIDAIFDEIPYMKLLVNRYDSQYKIVGPTYRTDGLGFAFPIGSPLAAYFSRAILNVTQGPEMTSIEQKNFGPGYSSQDPLSPRVSQGTSNLTFYDFAGLFCIVISVTIFAVFCSETAILSKLSNITLNFFQRCCSLKTRKEGNINVDRDTTNPEEDIHAGADRNIEEHNGEIVEIALNNEADTDQDGGGEINDHQARNL